MTYDTVLFAGRDLETRLLAWRTEAERVTQALTHDERTLQDAIEQIDEAIDGVWTAAGGRDPGLARWPAGLEQHLHELNADRDTRAAQLADVRTRLRTLEALGERLTEMIA